jgi:hypothetical protein
MGDRDTYLKKAADCREKAKTDPPRPTTGQIKQSTGYSVPFKTAVTKPLRMSCVTDG